MKKCIVCSIGLTSNNHAEYRRKAYINKCDDCVRGEKRIAARKRPKEELRNRSNTYNNNLKNNDPVKYTCKQLSGSSKGRAKAKGFDHNINTEFLIGIAPEKCPVFGERLLYGGGEKGKYAASIDRIDSSKGYTKGNVQIISYLANLMKSNATSLEMIKFSEWVKKGVHKDSLK